jgi:cell division control protein 6
MERRTVRDRMADRIQHMLQHAVIKDRRFLDDEQLIRAEQLALLEEVFNASVRDTEIEELSSHFAGILRGDHPCHLAIWGKTGTGKTLTLSYFLNLLTELATAKGIQVRHEHLDLSTPQPCFRALNSLACLFKASKRHRKGISLEELMVNIEETLADLAGYLIIFVDEVDNVRRDRDTFLKFLVRRLPQKIPAKLILVFVSNRLNWPDQLDPRVKSFLKLNELVFKPYDAVDLKHILDIRVEKALHSNTVEPGVIEQIAALASHDHGDARKAVALLAKSAYLAEKAGTRITPAVVSEATDELHCDRYVALLRTAPVQLKAAMAGTIEASQRGKGRAVGTGEAYDAYRRFCDRAVLQPLSGRAFGDLLAELDVHSFIRSRVVSHGRRGRTREITLDVPDEMIDRIHAMISMEFDLRG